MIDKYFNHLNFFVNRIGNYIEPEGQELLKSQILGIVLKEPNKKELGNWRLRIQPEYPIKFKPCSLNGNNIQVDFSCNVEGEIPKLGDRTKSANLIKTYNILIRIWSLEYKLSFRHEFDSENIKDLIMDNDGRRVIMRFHIDKRTLSTQINEPLYHMHFGGISSPDEINWFPKSIDAPRFHYFPLDIILASELVLNNFFSIESHSLREDPEWRSIINTAQEVFLKPCISEYYSFINDSTETFLTKTQNWN